MLVARRHDGRVRAHPRGKRRQAEGRTNRGHGGPAPIPSSSCTACSQGKEEDDWCIAYVRFSAPESGEDHERFLIHKFWLRFQKEPGWTTKDMETRAQEIAIAQYSPPMSHQEACDFCCKAGQGWDPDEYYGIRCFYEVEIMPPKVYARDDDAIAATACSKRIAECAKMKAERDRRRTTAADRKAEIEALKERHRREIEALKERHRREIEELKSRFSE